MIWVKANVDVST